MTLVSNNNFFQRFKLYAYLIPLAILCLAFAFLETSGFVHDYSNNYFPALLVTEGIAPETIVFDIFDFNNYVWSKGYSNELTDFYLNSPFIATLFYPLALIKNAYYSKLIFNLICIVLFLVTFMILSKKHLTNVQRPFLLLVPLIFYVPIRNNIEFGQLYLLIFSLILLAYHYISIQKNYAGASLLSLAVFIKIFPLFYCLPLLYNKKWLSIGVLIVSSLLLFCVSLYIGGWSFWERYLFYVLPNAIANESTVDFRSNAQSFDVFLKTIFVKDDYYNPSAVLNNVYAFKVLSTILKSLILAVAISLSFQHKTHLFKVLSIWMVALFLTQTRTATYAQILWLIPSIEVLKSSTLTKWKVLFLCLLLVICNFPFHWLQNTFILLEFSRLWLSFIAAGLAYYSFNFRFNLNFSKVYIVIFIPLLVIILLKKDNNSASDYVLTPNNLFMIHDFGVHNDTLSYKALSKKGNETFTTDIAVTSFDSTTCNIKNNQVYYKKVQLTSNNAIKKKPVLINGCEVFYLTDHHSRRGAFTLKKFNVCIEKR